MSSGFIFNLNLTASCCFFKLKLVCSGLQLRECGNSKEEGEEEVSGGTFKGQAFTLEVTLPESRDLGVHLHVCCVTK